MKWRLLSLSFLLAISGCQPSVSTPAAPLDAVKPVIEKALTRMGQTPKVITADDAAKFSKPFDVTPQVHYSLTLDGKDAVLSIYYLGNDDMRTIPLIQQLAQLSNQEGSSGVAEAYHMYTSNKKSFFIHLTTGRGQNMGLQNFLLQLFAPATTGIELGKALRD